MRGRWNSLLAAVTLGLLATACGGRPPPTQLAAQGAKCSADKPPGVVVFAGTDGECIPMESLALYSCAPATPPVVVRNAAGATPNTFVGGDLSVPLGTLPEGTVLLGAGADQQVRTIPGDPSRLFVRTGGLASRWVLLPQSLGSDEPSLSVIGDSISLGAEIPITDALAGWSVTLDGEIGRSSSAGVEIASQVAAARPDAVVVELGTNDADPEAFKQNLRSILDQLSGVPLVLVQTVHSPADATPEINKTIHREVERRPNTALADWATFVTDDLLNSDGVHPLPDHADEMALLIAPLLQQWLAATDEVIPPACAA